MYLFDTHCVTRRRLEDLHSEPDRWPFKERGYDPASGFLVELERHADMLRDRMSRFYLGEAEEQRRQAGLAKAGADEERKALAGELLGDRREEDDGEEPEEPEVPVADKRARGSGGGGCGRAEEDAADKVPSGNRQDRRGRRNGKHQHDGESGGEGEDLPDLDSEEESEVGSEEDWGGFEELERFLPKAGGAGCWRTTLSRRLERVYSTGTLVGRGGGWSVHWAEGRRTGSEGRAGTGTWCSRRWTLEEGWLAQCQQRYAGTTMVLEATGWLSRRGLHQGE